MTCDICGIDKHYAKGMCLSCYGKYNYNKNKDKKIKYQKEYNDKNKKFISERKKKYYIKNKEHTLQKVKENTNKNKDKYLQYQREYYWEHLLEDKKSKAKQKGLGFKPINTPWRNCNSHHINKKDVLFIPKELHESIYHRQKLPNTMKEINDASFKWWNNRLILIQGILNGIH